FNQKKKSKGSRFNRQSIFKNIQVFVVKLSSVDGLPAGAVVVGEVAALTHELRYNAMEAASLEAKALLVCAQTAEILFKKMRETISYEKNNYIGNF
uniref:Uncharacterized protein n=1 Tax=Oryzias melastigma TaxID=30732 RepID=A0A3B3C5C5_ORYME